MDIYETKLPALNQTGGELAANWDNCVRTVELWTGTFKPFFEGAIGQRFIRKTYEQYPGAGRYVPGSNNLGMMIVGSDAPPPMEKTFQGRSQGGSSMKRWKAAKRNGTIVTSPYSAHRIEARVHPGFISATSTHAGWMRVWANQVMETDKSHCGRNIFTSIPALQLDVHGTGLDLPVVHHRDVSFIPTSEEILRKAANELLRAFNNVPVDSGLVTNVVADANSGVFDVLTELGEMPETIKFIIDAVKKGVSVCLRFRKEMAKAVLRGGTSLAEAWMAFRYAIMPIIYSVNSGLELLQRDALQFQTYRGRKDTTLDVGSIGDYELTTPINAEKRVWLKDKFDMSSNVAGMKFNPLSTAWELVPLSFVVDWFFQVGDYLTALVTPSNVSQRAATFSVKAQGTAVWRDPNNSELTLSYELYRTAPTSTNVSAMTINSEVFVSWKRTLDAVALSWLIFKKNPRG